MNKEGTAKVHKYLKSERQRSGPRDSSPRLRPHRVEQTRQRMAEQRADAVRTAVHQTPVLVAALQRQDQLAASQLTQQVRQMGEAGRGDAEAAHRVAFGRVEAGGDDHEVGVELVGHGHYHVHESSHVGHVFGLLLQSGGAKIVFL